MKKCISICLLLLAVACRAEVLSDSLKISFKCDTNTALAFIYAANTYGWNTPDSMIANAARALAISEKLNYQRGMFLAYSTLSSSRYVTGNFGKGLSEAKDALDIARNNKRKDWEIQIYNTLGLLYLQTDKYKEAMEYFEDEIAYYTKNRNDTILGNTYNNLANCYFMLKEYPKSIEIRQKAIFLRKKLNQEVALGDSFNDMGETFEDMGMTDSAIVYEKLCLEIKEKAHDDEMTAMAALNLGIDYTDKRELNVAKKYSNQSYQLALKMKSKTYQLNAIKQLAKIAALENNNKEEASLLNEYIALNDSIYTEENQKQINLLHTEFETEKKELRIKSLQTEEQQQQMLAAAEKRENSLILVFSIIGFIALASFLLIVINRFRLTKKQYVIIEQQRSVLKEKNKDITDSINYSKRLQDAILPPISFISKRLSSYFILYNPKDIVSGDFYWMESVGDNILLAVADCTGHGVPGAIVSVVCSNALNRAVKEFKIIEPGKILDKVRELVLETFEKSQDNVQDGMDISLCCINTNRKEVRWSGAHNPLWYVKQGEIHELPPDKQPIGKHDNPQPFHTHSLNLQKGDTLYLFTDGYADQFGGPKGKKFRYKHFEEMLLANAGKAMDEQKNILENSLNEWKGNLEQVDDILVMGVRI